MPDWMAGHKGTVIRTNPLYDEYEIDLTGKPGLNVIMSANNIELDDEVTIELEINPFSDVGTPKKKPQKPRFTHGEIKNGLQFTIQLSTGYKAWVNLREKELDGIEVAFYDAFKYNYHPEGRTCKSPKEDDTAVPF